MNEQIRTWFTQLHQAIHRLDRPEIFLGEHQTFVNIALTATHAIESALELRADAAASSAPSQQDEIVRRLRARIDDDNETRHDDSWPITTKGETRQLLDLLAAGARAVPRQDVTTGDLAEALAAMRDIGDALPSACAVPETPLEKANEKVLVSGEGRAANNQEQRQPKVLHELRNVDDDQPSAGLITECCGRWIEAHDRFCPQCGHECRVRRETKGPIEQMIDEGSIGTGPFHSAVPETQEVPRLGDVIQAAFELWAELKPYVPSGQLENNPPARSVIERHLAKALARPAVPVQDAPHEELLRDLVDDLKGAPLTRAYATQLMMPREHVSEAVNRFAERLRRLNHPAMRAALDELAAQTPTIARRAASAPPQET